jgi:hypothetical protein
MDEHEIQHIIDEVVDEIFYRQSMLEILQENARIFETALMFHLF